MNGLTETLDPTLARNLLRELGADARTFRFDVAPNPCVGAAVMSGATVVARGFHRFWGGAHAEVDAFRQAAASGVPPTEWDTLLVTLEPCCSHGKTPACVDAILESGIRRVIVAALDPDPRHRGKGLEILRDRGVEVLIDPLAAPLESVSPHFLHWNDNERVRRPRPWTIAKWAQTLTGQLSPPTDVGEGRWISGPTSLLEVHELRSRVDAIVTGVGTVLHDNPRLTVRRTLPRPVGLPAGTPTGIVRDEPGSTEAGSIETGPIETGSIEPSWASGSAPGTTGTTGRSSGNSTGGPARVVLDSWLRTPPEARLFEAPGPGERAGPVHVMSLPGSDPIRRRALEAAGAQVHSNRGMDRHTLELRDLWTWLWDQGFRRVMLECGPTLLRNALDRGFVDQLRVYTGNIRGGEGESLAPWLSTTKLLERHHRESGHDAVLEAFVEG